LQKYNFVFSEEIKDSIKNTEKLIIVADSDKKYLNTYIGYLLYQINMPEVIYKVLTPNYQKIKSTLLDYVYEEAQFDYL